MVLIWEIEGLVWFSCVKAFTFGVEISELSTVGLGESVRDTTLDRAADTRKRLGPQLALRVILRTLWLHTDRGWVAGCAGAQIHWAGTG